MSLMIVSKLIRIVLAGGNDGADSHVPAPFSHCNKDIGVTGFEPTTPSSLTKCASQLRYTPIFNLKYLLFNRQMLLYMVTFRIARAFCNYF